MRHNADKLRTNNGAGNAVESASEVFESCLRDYPASFRPLLMNNMERLIWQIQVVLEQVPRGGVIVDVGAGVVPFMLGCARLGYQTIMIDDFQDSTYEHPHLEEVLNLLRSEGVCIMQGDAQDVVHKGIADVTFDCVVTHDSMEHWHHSPKKLFHELWKKLKPGGLFWVGVPNCVNLRKRITVPLGYGKWSGMKDWYEPTVFRGHVREPDVDDLRYIARDLGASVCDIKGKNWVGYRHSSKLIRMTTPVVDRILQLKPSFCSDIYLFAFK